MQSLLQPNLVLQDSRGYFYTGDWDNFWSSDFYSAKVFRDQEQIENEFDFDKDEQVEYKLEKGIFPLTPKTFYTKKKI
jgi:hypothetical protein